MTSDVQLLMRATRAVLRVVAGSLHNSVNLSRLAAPVAQQGLLVASAAETFASRTLVGHSDLSPIVTRGSTRLRNGASALAQLIDAVSTSSMMANYALDAVTHAMAHLEDGTEIPPVSAAVLANALWEEGSRWDDPALELCLSFCGMKDLCEILPAHAVRRIIADGLDVDLANSVITCVTQNPTLPVSEVRSAAIAALS
jgi:hypothetical protein